MEVHARLVSARRLILERGRLLAVALALFLAIYALRVSDSNVGDGSAFLFVVPIAVLSLGMGLRGGLVGAVMAFALVAMWDLTASQGALTVAGYLNRAAAFFVLGALLGGYIDQRRTREAELVSRYGDSLDERTRELDDARAETLHVLARAAEYRDDGTSEHTQRVGAVAAQIATRLGLPSDEVELLHEAALLHDVGKIAIADDILLKPGNLNPHEQEIMGRHAALGASLLADSSSPALQMAATVAMTHHEWWDGGGYPEGLAGEDIPLVGRIVAVADVFDALTHDRPYKAAWPISQAIANIRRAAGSQFDPRVVAAFLQTRKDLAKRARPPRRGTPASQTSRSEPTLARASTRSSGGGEPIHVRSSRSANPFG
jgi:putative nucleotidyltransferase with HDIG domain